MATNQQVIANNANAAKSTGPKTGVILVLIATGLFSLFVIVGCTAVDVLLYPEEERKEEVVKAQIERERIQVAADSLRATQADSLAEADSLKAGKYGNYAASDSI